VASVAVPRIRQIKPQFFTDEDTATLGLAARLMFIGLWTLADRAGRLEDKPLTIKLQTLPLDEVDPNLVLAELAARSLIYRYQTNGKRYISIPGFAKHQHCHRDEPESKLPVPEAGLPLNRQEPSNNNKSATLPIPGASTVPAPGKQDASTPGIRDQVSGNGYQVSGKKNRPDEPAAPNAFAQALNAWLEAWRAEKGTKYIPTGQDKSQLGRILSTLDAEAVGELPRLFVRYLRDPDPFVAKQGFSLAYFCTNGVNKYRLTPSNGVPKVGKWQESRETSMKWLDRKEAAK
jgi:hypothetical protein